MPDRARRSPQATLLLVRHGQSVGNVERRFGGHSDVPLTELGKNQAECAGRALVQLGVVEIVSSDLPRARQTAEIIGELTGHTPRTDPRWRERTVGVLDGMTFEQAKSDHRAVFDGLRSRDPTFVPPGGESLLQAVDRVGAAAREWLAHPAPGPIAIVSHGVAIHLALAATAGGPPSAKLFFHTDNASFTCLRGRPGEVRVEYVNDTRHLSSACTPG